jgi:hypothetical protein
MISTLQDLACEEAPAGYKNGYIFISNRLLIIEYQIVDFFRPKLKDEVMKVSIYEGHQGQRAMPSSPALIQEYYSTTLISGTMTAVLGPPLTPFLTTFTRPRPCDREPQVLGLCSRMSRNVRARGADGRLGIDKDLAGV